MKTIAARTAAKCRALSGYVLLRQPKRRGWLIPDEDEIERALGAAGIPVRDHAVDAGGYRVYFERAGYASRYPDYFPGNIAEKAFQHFVAGELLRLTADDVYIDIASQGSPVPEIYSRLHGCRTYAQDLSYEPGAHGTRIGSNAAAMPLEDGFATKMALHCSFEHFEGNSDTGFIREAARVLAPGGKLAIVPLYLSHRYSVATDLAHSRGRREVFEDDALVMAVEGWNNRHGRFYDATHLASRVLGATEGLDFSLLRILNAREADEGACARFALLGERIHGARDRPPFHGNG